MEIPMTGSLIMIINYTFMYGNTETSISSDLIDVMKIDRSKPENDVMYTILIDAYMKGRNKVTIPWEKDYDSIPFVFAYAPCYVNYEIRVRFG
jgi:hypothetical protein